VRVGHGTAEEVVGEQSVVLELCEDAPILVRPLYAGPLDLDAFARKFSPA